ncbi:cytochrome P450 [Auriscalpium vulgare]|uniref:Cytochrome P450 n=1 Tax=Auriscalpium vulgare TaxID=40419 RepID=A0ACB8RD19_9AGAM|nr:cytochrome P450 [Auriscalpium vulgare]
MAIYDYLVPVALSVSVALYVFWNQSRPNFPLPPGPSGHWLWGTEFPSCQIFKKYAEWTQQYGPVCFVRHGRRSIVIIGTYQAALDIMEKEGASTADRPRTVAGGEMMSGGMRILLIGVGERFRKLRKALHSHLQPKAAAAYEPLQLLNARQLIRDILDDPQGHHEHAKRYAASLILSLTYGKPSPSARSDPEVHQLSQMLVRLGQALRPGAHLVDDLPFLRRLPFYGFGLRQAHDEELELFQRQMQSTRDAMEKGNAPSSFAKYLVETQAQLDLSDQEIAYLAGSMFGAGSETTASAISFVIMAAACFPEAQAKVQEELDAVVGDRLPTFDDWDYLPQVHAFFQEVFRWRPGTSSGIQHRATKDIIYNGYVIPAGTTLIANHWSIGRDPAIFPDGDCFKPDRWLNDQGFIREDIKFPNFGFGRRICPGMPLANRSLFINTAFVLQSFKITPDPKRPIDTLAVREGVITFPLPFSVLFDVRNAGGPEALTALLSEEEI